MEKIIFIIGPISSGKSTIAKLIDGSKIIEIDDIYGKNLNGKNFAKAYKNKKFQDVCWKEYYEEIRANALENKLVVALTTGLNPKLKPVLRKLKKEFPKDVYVINISSNKGDLVNRTMKRKGAEKRNVLASVKSYDKLSKNKIAADFIIENSNDLKILKKNIKEVLNQLI